MSTTAHVPSVPVRGTGDTGVPVPADTTAAASPGAGEAGPARTAVAWPNLASPGLSPFHIEVPAGWTAVEPPGALIAFLGPEAGGFRPNVVVYGERLPREVTLVETAEQVLWETGAETATGPLADEDFPLHAIREAVVSVDGRELRQLVVATEAGDLSPGGLRSVFALLATHLASRTPADEPVIVDILASFTCNRAPVDKDHALAVNDESSDQSTN
ncbi:hypothetical protein ABGB17_29390 [Sphaerisporangium sp. B11E5]|uniref:hypothetical protein n=1 Tax=Sphaerisporangium sp. B11E5 TaxID=3153563 RepID=UPI00325D227C